MSVPTAIVTLTPILSDPDSPWDNNPVHKCPENPG
jgi:hypothetical protein